MFSPYGIGPLPPSAMAEIEKKTAALQANSLRKLLEMDKLDKKKHKVGQLQSAPVSPPSSPPPDGSRDRSIQVRRADSVSKQQNYLMLKAVRRSVVLPSLSIAIPQPANEEGRDQTRGTKAEAQAERGSELGGENETGADAEPLQKQVKFLAPDDDDEMSDQSSICQSPSWEGYGQRKKEKKKEAERRKKEKEQAEKEAKAAKKRLATRLSKSPPPKANGQTSRAGVLTSADRSLSDPLLISQYLLPESQLNARLDDIGRTASADDLQRIKNHQPAMAEVLSDSSSQTRRFMGGVKLDREREITLQNHLAAQNQHSPSFPEYSVSDDGADQRGPRSPPLESSGPIGHPSAQSATTKHEGRQQREAFPPSASRTPMLRHMPPPGNNRSNSLLQGASKIFRGRDGKTPGEAESERGRHRDGYVQRHREQSVERSVAELAYEQLINSGSHHSSSTRSSSRNTQHTRRSSFTQEARSVAMKLTGMKLTPSARDESIESGRASSQTDYFTLATDQTYSNGGPGASIPIEAGPVSVSNQENYRDYLAEEQLALSESAVSRGALSVRDGSERPNTAQSFVSSGSPSVAGLTSSKKGRTLREVAKASLGSSRGPHAHPDVLQPHMLVVPYSTLRSHVDSPVSSPEVKTATLGSPISTSPTTAALREQNSQATQSSLIQTPDSNGVKSSEVDAHSGSRVSEGSSSSSAYEDGSPPPSPVTTPDTSRPQSSKDVPFTVAEVSKATDGFHHTQDDDATLRQSSGGSNGSSTSTTPRQIEASDAAEVANEDRFSRTAIPLDIDCDAQSFTTSFSNLDNIDNIDETLANAAAAAQRSRQAGEEDFQVLRQPKRLRSLSDTNHRSGALGTIHLPSSFTQFSTGQPDEPHISIPPRSKRREAAGRPSTSHGETARAEKRQEQRPENDQGPEWGSVRTGKGSVRETADVDKAAGRAVLSGVEVGHPGSENTKREKVARSPRDQAVFLEGERASNLEVIGQTKETSFFLSRSSTPEMDPSLHSPTYASQGRDFIDSHGPAKGQDAGTRASSQTSTSPPSPQSPRFPEATSPTYQHPHRAHGPPRMASAPTPMSRPSSGASSARSATPTAPAHVASSSPSVARPAGVVPVSILKQPARSTSDSAATLSASGSRPPVLSALPKHMQVQAGISARPPIVAAEARMTPIAKMFVECCNCKFYHDMPSKLYECMAKPDAMVEDRLLGISGAITTMVKCPWCQHNMSTSCCAGYAAVVYLKERLH